MKKVDHTGLRTWIEVDTKALIHNYEVFRNSIDKKTKLCAVAKSNAYGHNLIEYARQMEKNGVDVIAVDSIVEAFTLRDEGITIPLFVLGYTLPELYDRAIEKNISITVSTLQQLEIIAKKHFALSVHLKIDTGMHRQGLWTDQYDQFFAWYDAHGKVIKLEGIFTHFASAKNLEQRIETEAQVSIFNQWIQGLKKRSWKGIVHAAATASTVLFPEMHFDMVRIGLGLYGYTGSYDVEKVLTEAGMTLKPALIWKSLISEIKKLPAGESIGYDFTAKLHRDSTIAIVPVGYWHGFPRALSNMGTVMVNGHEAHVLGRVSMDMLIIDVTDVVVKVGDEVTLLGSESPLTDPTYVASLAETSVYELITRLNPLIKKFYI